MSSKSDMAVRLLSVTYSNSRMPWKRSNTSAKGGTAGRKNGPDNSRRQASARARGLMYASHAVAAG